MRLSCHRLATSQQLTVQLPHRPSEDLYLELRSAFLARARDKEAMVRVQAVLGLGAFLAEDDDAPDDAEEDPLEVLLELIATDSSAYVHCSLSSDATRRRMASG